MSNTTENRCEKCGGELIKGDVLALYVPFFYPEGEEKKLKPKRSMISCDCCKDCGRLQNFTAKELEKLL